MSIDNNFLDSVCKEVENTNKKDEPCRDCDNTDIRTCVKCGKIRQAQDTVDKN